MQRGFFFGAVCLCAEVHRSCWCFHIGLLFVSLPLVIVINLFITLIKGSSIRFYHVWNIDNASW